jgi:hypothetical protein
VLCGGRKRAEHRSRKMQKQEEQSIEAEEGRGDMEL